jgi:hypothetical protein
MGTPAAARLFRADVYVPECGPIIGCRRTRQATWTQPRPGTLPMGWPMMMTVRHLGQTMPSRRALRTRVAVGLMAWPR